MEREGYAGRGGPERQGMSDAEAAALMTTFVGGS